MGKVQRWNNGCHLVDYICSPEKTTSVYQAGCAAVSLSGGPRPTGVKVNRCSDMEKVVINAEDAIKVVDNLMANENLYNRMIMELGDALQHIASQGEDLNVPEIRLSVLKSVAEARQESADMLRLIQSLKNGALPDYFCTD